MILGLLPNLADSFGTSIPKAGMLVTLYAISVTVGAPAIAIALERKAALLLLMGVFVAGNLLCAMAPAYNLLSGARVLIALRMGRSLGLGALWRLTLFLKVNQRKLLY